MTLTLGTPKPGKARQVMVSGLVGADGAPVGTFVTDSMSPAALRPGRP